MEYIGVFCGSSVGGRPEYSKAAADFAAVLCSHGLGMVYGAGNIGLMGVLAEEMLKRGGRVIGVIPELLVKREVCHTGLSALHIVSGMGERKELIGKLSDAFVALPGGFGTLDELAEVLTWYQLGITHKPFALLNTMGYWDSLISLFDKMLAERFIRAEHRANIIIESDPDTIISRLKHFEAVEVDGKWIEQLKQSNRF